ncbi:MAG: hypothetical protein B6D63_03355 [Candidatus Latescibacteria bacterium 4484_7]|nr:MAG: hypothetical protein B6D63_03355 [Candidatus Latescibacteria bacterium 4484_7]
MNIERFGAILSKEFIHIFRDPRSVFIIFILPILMMFLFGYAIDLNMKEVRIAVSDQCSTSLSRELVSRLQSSGYFKVTRYFEDPARSDDMLLGRKAQAVVIIPRDFEERFTVEGDASVGVVIDGSNANTASLIQGYIKGFFGGLSMRGQKVPLEIRPVMLYNRDMKSSNFIVPGLVALIMMMLGALLTSVTIAREKETGTMEQILVSPIRPIEIVAGKVVPYLVLAVAIAGLIIAIGHFWFGVPVEGSLAELALLSILFLLTALSVGLLISSVVDSQQVAMMLSLFATLLPSTMLSGFIFPLASMPLPLRLIARVVPATHYLVIIRGIMLKGNTMGQLWREIAALSVIALVFLLAATKRFSLKLSSGK